MARVTGLGGLFFKAEDPKKLYEWYKQHLGIEVTDYGVTFEDGGPVVWSIFPKTTGYFEGSTSPVPVRKTDFMMNFRVDDIDALLEKLRAEGVAIDPRREDHEYGRFAYVIDPEGNRIELWQAPAAKSATPESA